MTTREAADRLGVSIRRIQFLIQLGQLPAQKQGRDWWIEESEIIRIEQKRREAQSEKNSN